MQALVWWMVGIQHPAEFCDVDVEDVWVIVRGQVAVLVGEASGRESETRRLKMWVRVHSGQMCPWCDGGCAWTGGCRTLIVFLSGELCVRRGQ